MTHTITLDGIVAELIGPEQPGEPVRDRSGGGAAHRRTGAAHEARYARQAVTAREVGGKAWALARAVALGASVPPAGVVTASALRLVMRAAGLAPVLAALTADPPSLTDHAAQIARIEALFRPGMVPPALGREIARLATTIGSPLAIRSSAADEDSAGASFAGQYLSLLDVPAEDVLGAVVQVWASAWLPGVRAYRQRMGVASAPSMAVLLMAMVRPERAGVIFTVDPVGDPGDVRIEWASGLADGLMQGEGEDGGWVGPREPTSGQDRDRDPVDDPITQEVLVTALRLEHGFGCPLDIEWAHDGQRLWVVQARPITR